MKLGERQQVEMMKILHCCKGRQKKQGKDQEEGRRARSEWRKSAGSIEVPGSASSCGGSVSVYRDLARGSGTEGSGVWSLPSQ